MTNRSLQSSLTASLSSSSSLILNGTHQSSSSNLTLAPSVVKLTNSSSTSTSGTPKSGTNSPASSSNTNNPTLSNNNQTSSSNISTLNPANPTSASTNVTNIPAVIHPTLKVSLETPLMPQEKLYPTPSMLDNLPWDVEFDLRLTGCELIQTAGRLLKLPQTAMATGQVLFHRYFYSKSFVKNPMEYFAMASIFLSSKIEECPKRIRDVMNVFHHIKQVRTGKVIKPMPIDEKYYETKNQVIKAERRILKELGFCVHVKHPHKIIFIYLQAMEGSQLNLSQKAWNYMNDSLRTDIFLRYSSENIVCACIYLSANELGIPLPQNPPWYIIFGADEESIKEICVRILHLYTHQSKSQEELEKIVNDCRERLNEEKRKLKESTSTAALMTEPIKEEPPKNAIESSKPTETIKDLTSLTGLKTHKSSSNIGHESMPILAHYPNHPQHGGSYHMMSRHSSFNYNIYHSNQHYMNGGGVYPGPYHESYHNENYYDIGLKKNKSTSALLPPNHIKEIDEYSNKRHSSGSKSHKSTSKDRSRSHKDDSRYKISNQTNYYDYQKSKSRSRTRSRSPWKITKEDKIEKKSNRNTRKRTSRSRSRSMGSVESETYAERDSKSPVSSKHKKKKSHHSRHKEDSKEQEREKERSHHHRHKSSKSKARSKDRDNTSESKYVPIYS